MSYSRSCGVSLDACAAETCQCSPVDAEPVNGLGKPAQQTSTSTVEYVRDTDALHRPLPADELTRTPAGFAFHCTCGMTTVGFNSRSTARRRAAEHRAECAGGDVPLPAPARRDR